MWIGGKVFYGLLERIGSKKIKTSMAVLWTGRCCKTDNTADLSDALRSGHLKNTNGDNKNKTQQEKKAVNFSTLSFRRILQEGDGDSTSPTLPISVGHKG